MARVLSFDMGVRNLAYCQLARAEAAGPVSIVDWGVLDLLGTEKTARKKKRSIEQDCVRLLDALGDRFSTLPTDVLIAIEQQPVGRVANNIRMKVLSHVAHAHFHVRGHAVRFVSPRLKLRGVAEGAGYRTHKQYAVDKCAECVAPDPKWAAWFRALKKKDDAADALLQGLCALATGKRKRGVSVEYPAIQPPRLM